MSTKALKSFIRTEYVRPPVPSTDCDWIAYIEGEEEGLVGRGSTEVAALRDLCEQLVERQS